MPQRALCISERDGSVPPLTGSRLCCGLHFRGLECCPHVSLRFEILARSAAGQRASSGLLYACAPCPPIVRGPAHFPMTLPSRTAHERPCWASDIQLFGMAAALLRGLGLAWARGEGLTPPAAALPWWLALPPKRHAHKHTYRYLVATLQLTLTALLLSSPAAAATANVCEPEWAQAALLQRVRATLAERNPPGQLQRSWVEPDRLCGGRAPGVMGTDANGGWWGVTCDARSCVVRLYLAGRGFGGEVRTAKVLYLEFETSNPKSLLINPKPKNPKPQTPDPKPQTPNPKN